MNSNNKTINEQDTHVVSRPRAYSNSSSSSSSITSPISSVAPWTTSPISSPSAVVSSGRKHSFGSGITTSEAAAVAAIRKVGNGPNSSPVLNATSFRHAHANPHKNKSANTGGITSTSPPLIQTPVSSSISNGQIRNNQFGSASGYYKPPPPSTVAATAAAVAVKPKESALSKAKMFALQAAIPHLSSSSNSQSKSTSSGSSQKKKADLTIQTIQPTGRSSISERSPLTRPSKELERIASIASQNVSSQVISSSRDSEKHKNHYHLSFRSNKNTHGSTVLSSSASNSKLVSEQGSIYSFHPSSPGGIHKSLSALELKNLASKDDKDYIADESWSLLRSRVLPLFQGEGLRVPVEDLNDLVTMHLNFRIQQGVQAIEILSEFRELTKIGMKKLDCSLQKVSNTKLMPRLVELWQFFFSQVLPYWEAVFLPLQLEFEGNGHVLSPQSAKDYWGSLIENQAKVSIRQMTLTGFRDWVIVPISEKLEQQISQTQMEFNIPTRTVTDTTVRLFQCTSLLASIRSNDDNQKKIDRLIRVLKSKWLSRPRAAKDRRGFVTEKQDNIFSELNNY